MKISSNAGGLLLTCLVALVASACRTPAPSGVAPPNPVLMPVDEVREFVDETLSELRTIGYRASGITFRFGPTYMGFEDARLTIQVRADAPQGFDYAREQRDAFLKLMRSLRARGLRIRSFGLYPGQAEEQVYSDYVLELTNGRLLTGISNSPESPAAMP